MKGRATMHVLPREMETGSGVGVKVMTSIATQYILSVQPSVCQVKTEAENSVRSLVIWNTLSFSECSEPAPLANSNAEPVSAYATSLEGDNVT